MNFFNAFYLILPLFLIISLGWLLFKLNVASEHWIKVLNDFAFYVGLPLLSFINLYTLDLHASNPTVLMSNSIFMTVTILLTVWLTFFFRMPRKSACVVILSTLGNMAYMGYPINEMIFGKNGLNIAVIIFSVSTFSFFTVGIIATQCRAGDAINFRDILSRIIKIPALWAVVFGGIMGYFHIPLPAVFIRTLNMLASASSAVVLLALGAFMATLSLKGRLAEIGLIVLIKLAAFPFMFCLFSLVFPMDRLQFSVSMLQAAMPVGASVFTIADSMGLDKEVAASAIFATTVLSIFTLPILVALLT